MNKILRFKVGDLARIVSDDTGAIKNTIGQICEITSIGAYGSWNGKPWSVDYGIKIPGIDERCGAMDHELAPLPGDDQADYLPPKTREVFDPNKTVKNPDAPVRRGTVRA